MVPLATEVYTWDGGFGLLWPVWRIGSCKRLRRNPVSGPVVAGRSVASNAAGVGDG